MPSNPEPADNILAHPRFPEARHAHIEGFIGVFAGNRFIVRLLADAACLMTAALLVGFHAAYDENDTRTWATLGRLQRLIAARRLASPRRLDSLIARFRQTGYVKSVPSPVDRRIRILAPTTLLLAYDRAFLAALYRPLNTLYPERGYEAVVRQDARVHFAIRRAAFHALPTATAFMPRNPAIMTLLAHDAGYLAFLQVARALLANADPASEDLSYTMIAERLGVSRTHIRKLFVAAEAAGYVRLNEEGGSVVEIQPSLWEAFDRCLADLEAGHDAIAQLAFADMRSGSA